MIIRRLDKNDTGPMIIIALLAIVGDIVTIKTDLLTVLFEPDNIPNWASVLIYIAFVPIVGLILWFAYEHSIVRYLRSIGINNTPTSYSSFWRLKVVNKNGHLIYTFHHGFYHKIYKIRNKIRRNIIDKKGLQGQISDFLLELNTTMQSEIGLDLNIRVMLLAEENNEKLLIPYCHNRSLYEQKANVSRRYDYTYILLPDDSVHLVNFYTKAIEYNNKNGNGKYSTNSIFSYLIGSSERHWLSNNIEIDTKLTNFYTSCDCLVEGDIKSFAVFKLAPPDVDPVTRGFVIFDTNKKGAYTQKECVPLLGLIAHLINELFELINNETNG